MPFVNSWLTTPIHIINTFYYSIARFRFKNLLRFFDFWLIHQQNHFKIESNTKRNSSKYRFKVSHTPLLCWEATEATCLKTKIQRQRLFFTQFLKKLFTQYLKRYMKPPLRLNAIAVNKKRCVKANCQAFFWYLSVKF